VTRPIIFSGPSLLPEDRSDSRFDFRAPARQGDIIRAALEKPMAIGLIDGFFGSVQSVHQKEIIEALSQGIPVYGAASMGALRAAELAPYGMIGVGGIFDDFQSGKLDADADVAIAHGPAELGFVATSVSMVDVRATIEALGQDGAFGSADLRVILDQAARLHFTECTWEYIAQACAAVGVMSFDIAGVLKARHVQRKRSDALMLLDRLKTAIDPLRNRPTLPESAAYHEIRRRALKEV